MDININTELGITISRRELRVLLIHEFRLGHKVTESTRNICHTMGKGIISIRSVRRWFSVFKNGNFELDDLPRSGRPSEVNNDDLKRLIEEEPRSNTRCLAERFRCSHMTISSYLKDLGKVWKYGNLIPHQLSKFQLQQRVDTCIELLTLGRNYKWIHNLINDDEKWVHYVNYTYKRQWLGPRQRGEETQKKGIDVKKIMLSVWWNTRGVIYWELLPNDATMTSDLYCQQLDRVAEKLQGKQNKIYYLHDNARPHVSKFTRQKLLELRWTVLPHPPYSPDLAPTDYHLFRSLANNLRDKKFDKKEDLKIYLEKFFNQKSQGFYKRGICSLPERWKQVVDTNGSYIV